VLSIFVNPTQFNVAEDFDKYPRTLEHDLHIAEQNNIDVVYAPTVDVMYPKGSSVVVQPGTSSVRMEGAMRPGHFAGVTTVVSKLFNAVLPHRAYFGKKDFQQLAVIQEMVRDLDFPIEIVGVDTVRESDGLAMSSRNVRLTRENRAAASSISEGLFAARTRHELGEHNSRDLLELVTSYISQHDSANIEYVDVCNPVDLNSIDDTSAGAVICVAAWFGDVRLIDNVELNPA
jgi:pantoate--beta-alanine ligase